MANSQPREEKELSGVLFRNDRKREGKNDPSHQGSCLIAGKHYWIAAWVKDGAKGKFFSFAFKPKDQGPRKPDPGANNPPVEDSPPPRDEDCPF